MPPQEKDQYGNEVPRLARPLPVEYLLVDVPASTPLQPVHTFAVRPDRRPFPVENRQLDGHLHDFQALTQYLSQWRAPGAVVDDASAAAAAATAAADAAEFLDAVSDFHFLVFLSRMDMVPIQPILGELVSLVMAKDAARAMQWKQHDAWLTIEQLAADSAFASSR